MTLYDFLEKFGKRELFDIALNGKIITPDEKFCLNYVLTQIEERQHVIDALECEVVTIDMQRDIIYCER